MNIFKLNCPVKICIIALILISLFTQTHCIDSQFTSCEPRACENGPVIRYPFWLSQEQEAFCGYPGFRVTCNGSYPVIGISNDDYVIEEIFHANYSLLVANHELYSEQCPVPRQNFSLSETPFTLGFDHITDISLFYNCSLKPPDSSFPFPIECLGNKTRHSFAAFHLAALRIANYSADSCESWVNVPASNAASGRGIDALLGMNYTEILKMGFLLKWTGHGCGACEASGGRCGSYDGTGFVCFCGDKPHDRACDDGEKTNWKLKIIIGTVAALVGVILMSVVSFIYIRRYRKRHARPYYFSRKISSEKYQGKDVENGSTILGVRVFTHEELVIATNEFDVSKELGDGGFGTVYYGKLKDGRSVAVKRLYENNYKRVEQFVNEIEILAKMRHPNLVSLYGCTSQHCHELLLVYEFVSNGTVADHLYGGRGPPTELPWPTRLHIAVGTASALTYLHANGIIHRDVKTNNILLDETFTVKVADFGLSRLFPTHVTHVSTAPQGTPGYVDPDYHLCYQLTSKSDVFSFGVVLMELVSSLPAVDITRHRHDINLSTMAVNRIQNHALGELVDRRLGFETDATVRRSITAVAELAFQCLQQEKDLRPCMETVLSELKAIQSRDYGVGKAEKNTDTAKDDAVLLKNGSATLSPDTVTVSWHSRDTTPNAST